MKMRTEILIILIGIIGIVLMMVVPIPIQLLDFLLDHQHFAGAHDFARRDEYERCAAIFHISCAFCSSRRCSDLR